ncbi:MAG: glycosyltransferase family 1 protein [Ignavibacteriae bacterium]|nr:MAG: glycosyltransferase family 1 protein [Ignavibacteriota bacterium]
MKVLYVTSNGGIHDYRFLKKLVEDYDVLLLHYASDTLIDEIKNINGLKIISKNPAVKSFPFLSERSHFKKVYNDFKPDIVHSGYVWQVGILASNLNVHPHLSMPWGSDILVEPDKSILKRMLVKKVINQCDHLQCDAEFVKKKMIDDYKIPADKVTVFPWGIDLNLFKPSGKQVSRKELGLDDNLFIVVFNRHLTSIYGVSDLMEGFKLFSTGKDDVKLLMVSGGPQRIETQKFINDNNLNSKITITGRVPNAKLPVYLNASDIYISTSLSDGTSLSLLEAMAMGLGIIVTDVPAIREWINNDNGIIVPINKSQEIAKALESYYLNRQLIAEHGTLNKEIAKERADWDKNYLKLKEIFDKIV